ncbi:bifunctional adenosylcobinamide kinase/adenosylcobinamide-phosphate guanylyltransferase [Parahaliea sp. F7430]|uniref:Bifunctional adenosylcobalamin biosynthesis protein n=1 Tax=Sediminihaliea albiluteola TaxID=2758564 RepID=A0A7W2TVE0_9GAMM|nr:bifunctional adenosylcobinamide kinase/adenosylcobinamide-phosphate guanylyltransferase [Sediminihaliea albiluteola]MBA6412643.1 bifunctional adenosylcobinamide kinase/adenosylcobinamide-phosphate guanylyltransferase [Sediminihaliea albiluteola]
MKHLVLGGARSGKSRYAESCAEATGKTLFYLATAQAGDQEMSERIAHHRQSRSSHWQLIEEPVALHEALATMNHSEACILIDCLTLWLSNCLLLNNWETMREAFLSALDRQSSDIILVSNEVGHGMVPLGELNRRFVDESGRLHQSLAAHCDKVTLVTAGLAQTLKEAATP